MYDAVVVVPVAPALLQLFCSREKDTRYCSSIAQISQATCLSLLTISINQGLPC